MVILWECKSRGPGTHRDYVPRSVSVKLETSEIGSGPPAGQVIGQNEAERSHSRDFSSVCPRQSSEARKMSQSQIQRCRPIGCLIPLFGSSGGHQDSNDYFTPSAVPRLRPIVVIGARRGHSRAWFGHWWLSDRKSDSTPDSGALHRQPDGSGRPSLCLSRI